MAKAQHQVPSTKPQGKAKAKPQGKPKGNPTPLPWTCCASLQGRLTRTKPDDNGTRRLIFTCTDGTRFEVVGVGNDTSERGGALYLLAHADQAFNQDGYWLVYPADYHGKPALTLAHRTDRPRGNTDTLKFTATVKAITQDTLTLFVGRRGRRGFNFVPLAIPSGLVLPEGLEYQAWVIGTAKRHGHQWELSTIEPMAKPE